MIKITVELWPLGIERMKRHLGTMNIWNDATSKDRQKIGNYQFTISKVNSSDQVWKRGEVKGFPRLSSNVWKLIYLCMKATYDKTSRQV